MQRDAFPTTRETWIDDRLGAGEEGRLDVNEYLMRVYAEPLRIYFQGTTSRWLGEPDDVVHGFFADRLARAGFLSAWAQSGLRLRRWLMNGFSFYLKELRADRRRDRRAKELTADVPTEPDTSAIDRAFVVTVVREALREAEASCRARGLDRHWDVFVAHHYEEKPYAVIATDHGIDAARAAVMARSGSRTFVRSLREVLARDGATPATIDQEIRALLEVAEP